MNIDTEKAGRRNSYVIRSAASREPQQKGTVLRAPRPVSPIRQNSSIPLQTPISNPRPAKSNPIGSVYMSLSWIAGFREKYSLLLFLIFGGALLGFCLARSLLMDPVRMRELTVPGEFFWFNMPLYKYNYIIHIYLTILGGIFSGLQFLPVIRRKYVLLHRLNGYFVLVTLIVGNVCGGIISRRSFGGELNQQSAYYILALMTVIPLLIGYWNVKKNTRLHRKWMLRAVVYFSTVISARLIMLAAGQIITDIGSYYSLWRCDEILFVLKDLSTLTDRFPQCIASGNILANGSTYVPVHASNNEGDLGAASAVRACQGMSLWIATLLHVVGIELYLRKTEEANYQRHGFALEPRDYDPDKDDLYQLHYSS
ncbi:hypothetical protein Moror_4944 [Moniliophthora roreri MCA 2997]|uniref:DUF2306 domain-containing protein n=2 Tax=Moniliophthora roreri TaxID=221103 RepID=V2WY00_MONRO|nr:hypothetical protein Moror_4944 [Moniliophthora roreri MCA 2997]